jgi:hypothetical protein
MALIAAALMWIVGATLILSANHRQLWHDRRGRVFALVSLFGTATLLVWGALTSFMHTR